MAENAGLKTEFEGFFARAAGRESTVLAGPALKIVRGFVLLVILGATTFYVIDLFALWDETHRLQYDVPDLTHDTHTTVNYYGLTSEERGLLTGSSGDVPGWYPVFVVVRQAILAIAAVGLAWLIYSRRPRNWMAYLTTVFIVLTPVLGHIVRDDKRLEDTLARPLDWTLEVIAMVTLGAFLWLFPDGRFRRPAFGVMTFIVALLLLGLTAENVLGINDSDPPVWIGVPWFLLLLGSALFWAFGGMGAQIWRYRNTPMANRRLARWNLAFLIAVPLWFLPFEAFHDLFSDSDVGRYTISGFVWEQIHETLYLLAPVLMGVWILFLVRRQGWWDFQTLWNRTAVYGIGLIVLSALYGAVIGLVSVAASPLTATGEQAIAVIAATAIVAFSYGPVLSRVRTWVDERWFPKRAQVDVLSLAFAEELRASDSPTVVADRLRATVQNNLDPQHVELWTIRGGDNR